MAYDVDRGCGMSESDADAAGSRKSRRKSLEWKTIDLAGWRTASTASGEVAAGPGGAENDYERRKRLLSEKVEAEARLREDAYPLRNVAGAGMKVRLVIDVEESEGVLLESVIRLGIGRSSRDLPPDYARLLACDADGKKRMWFDKILQQVGSVEVRVLRYVTKWRTLIMVSWTLESGRRLPARPRYLETAGDCVEECCGYSGELKDAVGRSLGEVVYGWFPHTDADRIVWFGDDEDAGVEKPASVQTEIPAGPPVSKPPKRERKKRKEISIETAAFMCGVSERTIKNWEAGKATPRGWPGRSDLRSMQTFSRQREDFKRHKNAIRAGLKSLRHSGNMDMFADDAENDL